jgi:hypothetical protein
VRLGEDGSVQVAGSADGARRYLGVCRACLIEKFRVAEIGSNIFGEYRVILLN